MKRKLKSQQAAAATRPRSPSRFRRVEARRLVRATIEAGLPVARIEVDTSTGKISVIPGKADASKESELDNWMKQHGAHSTERA
jgi:hypothetical protein